MQPSWGVLSHTFGLLVTFSQTSPENHFQPSSCVHVLFSRQRTFNQQEISCNIMARIVKDHLDSFLSAQHHQSPAVIWPYQLLRHTASIPCESPEILGQFFSNCFIPIIKTCQMITRGCWLHPTYLKIRDHQTSIHRVHILWTIFHLINIKLLQIQLFSF